jgi:hypothetical protein
MQNQQTVRLEPIFWPGSIGGRGFKELLTTCEGELNINRMVNILKGKGFLESIGVEIFGDAIDKLSSSEAGLKRRKSILQYL